MPKSLILNISLFLCLSFTAFLFENTETSLYNGTDSTLTGIISCDSTIWQHVYTPRRLVVLKNCTEVTGIIYHKPRAEGDGDYHIYLKLDSGQENYLNSQNYKLEDSCLVIEPVCAVRDYEKNKVKITPFYKGIYSDLPEACDGYINKIHIPNKGEHVRVRGSLVIDKGITPIPEHGWMEIHPVTSIEIIK